MKYLFFLVLSVFLNQNIYAKSTELNQEDSVNSKVEILINKIVAKCENGKPNALRVLGPELEIILNESPLGQSQQATIIQLVRDDFEKAHIIGIKVEHNKILFENNFSKIELGEVDLFSLENQCRDPENESKYVSLDRIPIKLNSNTELGITRTTGDCERKYVEFTFIHLLTLNYEVKINIQLKDFAFKVKIIQSFGERKSCNDVRQIFSDADKSLIN